MMTMEAKLSSLSDVTHALALSLARERAVDAELETVLSKRAELERSFLMLSAPAADVRIM
jgi:hypothetical protein